MTGPKDGYGCLLVFCESGPSEKTERVSLEMLGLGRELAQAMGSELCAAATDDIAKEVGYYGASHIYIAPAPTGQAYCPEWYVTFVEETCKQCNPAAIIFAHTPLGQDLAPRLAERLGAGLVTDCTGLSFDGENLLATKPVQGSIPFPSTRGRKS